MLPDTLSWRLAGWAHALRQASVPPEVFEFAKLRILDIAGAMLGGRDTRLAGQVRRALAESEVAGGTPVVGSGVRLTPHASAMLQGTMACALEFDDSHVTSGIHPSSPIVAAALAAGLSRRVGGSDLVMAVLLGDEISCRLALAAPGVFHRVGFHPTAMVCGFGAVHAVAKLAASSVRTTAHALGISASFAAGIMASWEDGTDAKSLHCGWAAAGALQALAYAEHGITGPAPVYEGRFGFFRAHAQQPGLAFDFGAVERDLGEHWEIMNIAPRLYPCGHYIQPFIEAALALRRDHDFSHDEVERVVCRVADYMIPLICEPAAEKRAPATPWHARYSLPFCIAESLIRGSFTRHSLAQSDLEDPRYVALAGAVGYECDPQASDRTRWCAEIVVTLRSGMALRKRIPDLRGTPRNPMTRDELVAKFLHNAQGVLPDRAAREAIDRLLRIDQSEDAAAALEPLYAPAG